MKNSLILQWLKTTKIPLSVIARKTKLTRKSLHNWKNGSNPTVKSINKLVEFYNSSISVETESNNLNIVENGTIDKDYVLKLQQEKIEGLEKEVTKINAEKFMWDSCPFDFEQKLQLKWHITNPFMVQRAYVEMGNIKLIKDKLGYSTAELNKFYDPFNFHCMNQHPVDRLLMDGTKKYLKKTTKTHYGLIQKLLIFKSRHFIPLSLTFKHKKGYGVNALSFVRINPTLIIEAKTKFV